MFAEYSGIGSRKAIAKPQRKRRIARKVAFSAGFELRSHDYRYAQQERWPIHGRITLIPRLALYGPSSPLRSHARTARFGFITNRERGRTTGRTPPGSNPRRLFIAVAGALFARENFRGEIAR
jgi:hypothetical protein